MASAEKPRMPFSTARFVQWCFRPATSTPAAVPPQDAAAVAASLTHHRGWGLLHARRHLVDAPDLLLGAAAKATRRSALEQMAKLADLRLAASRLDTAGVPWLLVKGPVLAETLYRHPEQRPYGDLDVLVAPANLRSAMHALEQSGWSVLDRNWLLARQRMWGEVHLRGPGGTVMDLHWSLQNRISRRRRIPVAATGLIEASTPVDLSGLAVRTTSWADTVVHLCTHACGDGADRLLPLSDIARLLSSAEADEDELVDRAEAWAATGPTSLVLRRVARELGLPPARALVRRLTSGSGLSALDAAVDRVFPVSAVSSAPSLPGRWARRRMDQDHRSIPRLRGRGDDRAPDWGASNPYSLLHDAGGPAGREAYLAAVEEAGHRTVSD